MIEIERKFLVRNTSYKNNLKGQKIIQGFLNRDPDRTVRVRITGDRGFLTVKGKSNSTGTTRFEWETIIDWSEALSLLDLCQPEIVEKVRYSVACGDHVFEVDEFMGVNKGLVIAEVELGKEDEVFEKPEWLGREVTGMKQYYNSQLSKNPYTLWND